MCTYDNYLAEGNSFFKQDKILFKAKANIQHYLVLGNSVLILVSPDELSSDRNVYCYNSDGDLKWQIPEPEKIHSRNYYTSIYLSPANELKAYNVSGVEVTIDTENGRIVDKELIK